MESDSQPGGQSPGGESASTGGLLKELGGEAGIRDWVERFYAKIATHPLLAPMFTDLETSKAKQFAYFVELFGGPRLYSEQYGRPFMRFLHRQVKIGQPERDAWVELVLESLAEVVDQAAARAQVATRLEQMADKMINHHPEVKDAYYFQS